MRRFALLLVVELAPLGCSAPVETTAEVTAAYTPQCAPPTIEGTDVAAGAGTVDWAQVAASGRTFAFLKATQGDYNTQTRFAANWSGSKAAGVLRSPYHFFDPTIDGVAQAQHFLSVLGTNGGLQSGDLPPMLDLECPTSSTQPSAMANCLGTGGSGWVPTATLVARVFDWLATVEQATGRKPIIYTYPSWYADVGFSDARIADNPLFIVTVGGCASVPLPWTAADFWQYSVLGTVPGIGGQTDLDRFFGTGAQLLAYALGPADAGGDATPRDAASEVGLAEADAETEASAADADAGGDTVVASGDAGSQAQDADGGVTDAAASADDAASVADADASQPPPDVGAEGMGSGHDAPAGASGGCSCRVGTPLPPVTPLWAFALLGLLRRRRRPG